MVKKGVSEQNISIGSFHASFIMFLIRQMTTKASNECYAVQKSRKQSAPELLPLTKFMEFFILNGHPCYK